MPWILLAEMEIPTPVPQNSSAQRHSPFTTASQAGIGIVYAVGVVGAEINKFQAQLSQMLLYSLFQLKTAVICGERDGFTHGSCSFFICFIGMPGPCAQTMDK